MHQNVLVVVGISGWVSCRGWWGLGIVGSRGGQLQGWSLGCGCLRGGEGLWAGGSPGYGLYLPLLDFDEF